MILTFCFNLKFYYINKLTYESKIVFIIHNYNKTHPYIVEYSEKCLKKTKNGE